MILQLTTGTSGAIIETAARIVGTAVLAGFLAAAVALFYRWYVRERVPAGLALLVGMSGVAVVAGATSLLAQQLAPGGSDPDALAALLNVLTFLVGGAGAYTGMRIGDALGVDLFAATGGNGIEGEVSELVKAVGRVISVEIPDEIDDVVGYDPVPEATKETLAGRTFLFPRRLTQAELRERFVARLKTDYGVGHVDVEFDESGGIEYLALGSRAAGIGPTLPPATNAVAIRADPANAASAGDLVQVWESDPPRRVLTGELRGVAGEIVTVAIDAGDTPKLDPTRQYKLVTLPVQDRPDREFASLLRAADETLATITVEPGSRADGMAVDALGATIAAVTREDEQPTPLPARDRVLRAGDVLYAIAKPDALRKLEATAETPDDVTIVDEPADETDDDLDDDPSAGEADELGGDAETGGERAGDPEIDGNRPGDPDAGDDADEPVAETDETATTDDATSEPERSNGDRSDRPNEPVEDEPAAADDPSPAPEPDDELPSGGAFPDSDDLPGIDPTGAMEAATDEGEPADGDEIPETDAFPDTDDLPGADVDDVSGVGTTADDGSSEDLPDDEAGTGDEFDEQIDDEFDDPADDFGDLLDEEASDDDGLDELLADDSGDATESDADGANESDADGANDADDEADERDGDDPDRAA